MSFRYTNHLVATLKHRLSLEAVHRRLVQRTFVGTCNGIEVTCTAYGTVVGLRMLDRTTWEPLYRVPETGTADATPLEGAAAQPSSSSTAASSTAKTAAPGGKLDLLKLSASIQAATWQAVQQIRSAKEEACAQSLRRNPQLLAEARLRDWYEQDANTLLPRPCDGLKQVMATEWMQAVRFGLPQPARFLRPPTVAGEARKSAAEGHRPRATITVLTDEDSDPASIPIGSAHPLFVPGLVQLERDANDPAAARVEGQRGGSGGEGDGNNDSSLRGSCIDDGFVLSEQRKEMSRDEEAFWERVELIRRSQLATLPKGGVKRGYADMAATVQEHVEEKVQLRFTR